MDLDPRTIVWELTLKCNLQCSHCGSDATKYGRENELDMEESLDLVAQIKDTGFKRVVLSGGEPTLRKDWHKIAQQIKEFGLEFGIISNALAWNESILMQIADLNPFSVGLSIDGGKELHNELRGNPASYDRVTWAFRALKESSQYTCAITTVTKINLAVMEEIRDILTIYGVDAWQVQLGLPMGRMGHSLVLSQEEYYSLGEFLAESQEDFGGRIKIAPADCIGYYGKLGGKLGLEWEGCWAGVKGLSVGSDGTIRGCLSMPSDNAGNIRKKRLAEIWQDDSQFIYNRKFTLSNLGELCGGCSKGLVCRGGCQSQSYAHFHRFNNSPYCFLRHEMEV